jgi:hypothetical protein
MNLDDIFGNMLLASYHIKVTLLLLNVTPGWQLGLAPLNYLCYRKAMILL